MEFWAFLMETPKRHTVLELQSSLLLTSRENNILPKFPFKSRVYSDNLKSDESLSVPVKTTSQTLQSFTINCTAYKHHTPSVKFCTDLLEALGLSVSIKTNFVIATGLRFTRQGLSDLD